MIIFDLECVNGHIFEGWFDNRDDMKNQQAQGILICPVCETNEVTQKLSAFAVRTKTTLPAANNNLSREPKLDLKTIEALNKRISEFVVNDFENVGAKFSEEALKIHYGATEARSIRRDYHKR